MKDVAKLNKFLKGISIVVLFMIITGCNSKTIRIKGKIYSNKQESLSLIDLRAIITHNKKIIEQKLVDIERDGTIEVNVKQKEDPEFLWLDIARIDGSAWINPFFSAELKSYKINPRREVLDIGKLYITDPIKITSPKPGVNFNSKNNIIFAWEKLEFADVYSVNISLIQDKNELLLSTHNLVNNRFSYKGAKEYRSIEGRFTAKQFLGMGPVNRKIEPLIAGKYRVSIDAYVLDHDNDKIIKVGGTNRRDPFYFTLQ